MSAECEECGADLAYDGTCQRCRDKARIAELEAMGTSESARLSKLTVETQADLAALKKAAQDVGWFDFSSDDHDVFMAVERMRDTLAAIRAREVAR